MDGGDLPYNPQINICVVMGNDVSHASHLSEREIGHCAPGFFTQVRGGFTYNFDSPDHGILFLLIGPEIRLRDVFQIRCDQAGRHQDIAQAPDLVSLHRDRPRSTKFARAQNGLAISR